MLRVLMLSIAAGLVGAAGACGSGTDGGDAAVEADGGGGRDAANGGGDTGGGDGGTAACVLGGSPVATTAVTVKDFSFDPACIKVAAGTTVTWTNTGMPSHTVTSDSGAPVTFDSGALGAGGTFEFTFGTAGVVDYHCTPHEASGMKGTVVVE